VRIATWNVNSLKARLEKVEWWLERAAPDILLLQETKLSDDSAPLLPFSMAGYELLHHGEGTLERGRDREPRGGWPASSRTSVTVRSDRRLRAHRSPGRATTSTRSGRPGW
jgi:hypothetical protein